ncbi:MAG: B12-binding domain-containing radical SAM protein [Candidatus Omnitrophica bacterium]|nr:B12-binding domain-containing radical SAM protein [Candidatus Omnitrophota bacterium]
MRIAFVQEELYPYLSFMYLAAIAKEWGYQTEVFISDVDNNFINSIANYQPDIVCFSVTTNSFPFAKETAKNIKVANPKVFSLVGGWHPTFHPEILEKEDCFDALCLGEGEGVFRELLKYFSNKDKIRSINSLHVKVDGKIYCNPIGSLVENLDDLPLPLRSIYYDKFEILRDVPTKIFNAGRGCPFPCTYCFNEKMKETYSNKGKYVRFRSAENIVREINSVKERYPIKYVQFIDDTFNSDRKWLMSFLDLYKEKVGLPFLAACRVNRLDEELIVKMKEAGVDKINIAVEHGNEKIRREMLRRDMTNAEILEGGRLLRKYKIRFHISNIVGFPGETMEQALETLKLNQQLRPEFAAMHVFQPYPGTQIYQYFKDKGYFKEDLNVNDMPPLMSWGMKERNVGSVVKQGNIHALINLHSFFSLLVRHPYLWFIVKPLLNLKPNKYFEFFQSWYVFKMRFKYATNSRERINYLLQLTQYILPAYIQSKLEHVFKYYRQI